MTDNNRSSKGIPDMEVSKGRDVPSRLFRIILSREEIGGTVWEILMDRLLNDPRNPMPRNSKDRSSQKGNLNKALKAENMTWKTFEKGLRFLGVKKARISVDLTWPNHKTTSHYVDRYLGSFTSEDFTLTEEEMRLLPAIMHPTPPPDDTPRHLVLDPPSDPNVAKSIRQAAKALDDVSRFTSGVGKIPLRRKRRPDDSGD